MPAAGGRPSLRRQAFAPPIPTGASAAPFANAYNAVRTTLAGGGSMATVRQSASRTLAREPAGSNYVMAGSARYVKEMAADLDGLAVPGGRWGWAGPDLYTRALWGSRTAQAPARAWNAWQPQARDGSLLLT